MKKYLMGLAIISLTVIGCSPSEPEPYAEFPPFQSVMADLEEQFGCHWAMRDINEYYRVFCVSESVAGSEDASYDDTKIIVGFENPESKVSAQSVDDFLFKMQKVQVQYIRFYMEKVNFGATTNYFRESFGFDDETINRLMEMQTRTIVAGPYKIRSLPVYDPRTRSNKYGDTVSNVILENAD